MALIKKYYGPFLLLCALAIFGLYKWYGANQFKSLYAQPQPNDIYIFRFENKYSPYLLDFITADSFYFYTHPYDFSEAMPSEALIGQDAFKTNIHYIYSRPELDRLLAEDKIIKIYR